MVPMNDDDEDDRDAPKADSGSARSKSPWGGAAGDSAEAGPSDPGSGTGGGAPIRTMSAPWGGQQTLPRTQMAGPSQGPGPGAAAGGGPTGAPNWGMLAQRLGAAPQMGGTTGEGIHPPGMGAPAAGMQPGGGGGWLHNLGQMLAQRHAMHGRGGPWRSR